METLVKINELETKLHSMLKDAVNRKYILVFNYKPLVSEKDEGKTHYLRIFLEMSTKNLVVGYLKGRRDDRKFIEVEGFIDKMWEDVISLNHLGYKMLPDTILDSKSSLVSVQRDDTLNIISIRTTACRLAYSNVNKNKSTFMSGLQLDAGEFRLFKDRVYLESFSNYIKFVKEILLPKVISGRNYKFEFYRHSFLLVNVDSLESFTTGTVMFNPFTYFNDFSSRYKDSYLYKTCTTSEINYGNFKFGFLNYQEACASFRLNKYIEMPFDFYIQVLSGLFLPNFFPSESTSRYLYTGDMSTLEDYGSKIVIDNATYNKYKEEGKYELISYYKETSTLSLLCKSYESYILRARKRVKGFKDIYNLFLEYELLMI